MAKKEKKRRVFPIYLAALAWVIWPIFLPLYEVSDFLFLGSLSSLILALGYGIRGKNTTGEVETTEEKQEEEQRQTGEEKPAEHKRPRTGDATIDKMLDDEEMAVAEMKRLNEAILDEKLSNQIDHLEDVTSKIVTYVVEHPSKKTQVRRFFNYYLPTTLKLLNAYDRMDEAGISGINIDGTKGKVEEMMDKALDAFDRQLDALYTDEAMDISSDISVMESLLAQEGLAGDDEIVKNTTI
ncbi:MAG: 5-bromo-4-chloroindolyl phosphate hydrolysis family protein [Lachnospiraceae bacterium]|nr:5-bromo-4-chloroindolyl phosphate hydrolysis family protein [Lachnospiraceae bacterium]